GSGAEIGSFALQSRDSGLNQSILTSNLAGPEMVDRAKKAAESVIFLAQDMSPASQPQPVAGERKRKLTRLDTFAAEGYDMMHIVARAVLLGGPGTDGIAKGLRKAGSFDGINGDIRIIEAGSKQEDRPAMTVKNGKYTAFEQ
ncbi:MAG: hypothetical protein WC889_10560, partial [Myxococcota bacterium]